MLKQQEELHNLIEGEYAMRGCPGVDVIELYDGRKIAVETGSNNGVCYGNCWFIGEENEQSFELQPIFEKKVIDEEESDFEVVGYYASRCDEYMKHEYWFNKDYVDMLYSQHENGGYYVV